MLAGEVGGERAAGKNGDAAAAEGEEEKVVMGEVVRVFSANLLFHLCSPPALQPRPAKRHFTSHPHTHGARASAQERTHSERERTHTHAHTQKCTHALTRLAYDCIATHSEKINGVHVHARSRNNLTVGARTCAHVRSLDTRYMYIQPSICSVCNDPSKTDVEIITVRTHVHTHTHARWPRIIPHICIKSLPPSSTEWGRHSAYAAHMQHATCLNPAAYKNYTHTHTLALSYRHTHTHNPRSVSAC